MREKGAAQDGTVEQYYWKVLEAKRANEEWVKNIYVDLTTQRSIQDACLSCGNPDLSNAMSGLECKRCGINRLIEIYGYTKESAEKEYEHRQQSKERTMKFYEMARNKKVSKNVRRDEDIDRLPF